jgi:hypothetical protein
MAYFHLPLTRHDTCLRNLKTLDHHFQEMYSSSSLLEEQTTQSPEEALVLTAGDDSAHSSLSEML